MIFGHSFSFSNLVLIIVSHNHVDLGRIKGVVSWKVDVSRTSRISTGRNNPGVGS